jgi:iron complex outermembrane receptor protein
MRSIAPGPIAIAVLVALAAASAATADDEALTEIVVTATKQEVTLDRVPISVSALTQDMMDARGMRSIGDVVAQTPGLDLRDQGANGAGDRVSIRGIDSNIGATTTGIYVDDTPVQARSNPINLAGSAFPQVFDVERVEVLRGPQGTLFGAGAMGGVVRFITPTPSLTERQAYVRSEVVATRGGGFGFEAGAAGGTPLIEDRLAIRASAWVQHEPGWVDRTGWESGSTTNDANWSETGAARVALRWKPNDSLDVQPSVLFQNRHDDDSPVWWDTLSDPGRRQFVSGFETRQPSNDRFVLPSLKIEWAAPGGLTVTSITSYYHRDETNVTDVTHSDFPGNMVGNVDDPLAYVFPVSPDGGSVADIFYGAARQNVITQELRFQNSPDEGRVRWVAGAFFQRSRLQDTQYASNPKFAQIWDAYVQDAENGIPDFESYYGVPLLDGIYEYTGVENSSDTQYALFGNVDWPLSARLTLNAGLRVARTKVVFRADEDGPINGGFSSTGGSATDTPVTPRIGLSFQMDEDTLLYASAAKGYRIGGANSAIPAVACGDDLAALGLTSAPGAYSPDTTLSFEIGAKTRLNGGRLALEASAFDTKWKNVQQYYFLPTCGYGFVSNQGQATSRGFDLNVTAKLSSSVTTGLAIGYVDAKFDESIVTQGLNTRTGASTVLVAAGQTLGQTPWSATAFLEFERPLTGGARSGYIRLQDQYGSRNDGPYLWQNVDSTSYDPALAPTAAVNRLDVRFGLRLGALDVSAFVQNALDQTPTTTNSHWVYSPGGAGAGSPVFFRTSQRPRTLGFTALYRY